MVLYIIGKGGWVSKINILIYSIIMLFILSGCNQETDKDRVEAEGAVNNTKEKVEDVTEEKIIKEEKIVNLIKKGKLSEVEQLLEEGNLGATIDVDIVESYIDFIKSTEPMSLKAAKLMDSVRFGYNGILSDEIEAAIYSKHEENSITRETFPDREGYDELDWKYNEGTNYQRAKEYREIVLKIESEKVEKAQLIEEAKGKNPHLGMSRNESSF